MSSLWDSAQTEVARMRARILDRWIRAKAAAEDAETLSEANEATIPAARPLTGSIDPSPVGGVSEESFNEPRSTSAPPVEPVVTELGPPTIPVSACDPAGKIVIAYELAAPALPHAAPLDAELIERKVSEASTLPDPSAFRWLSFLLAHRDPSSLDVLGRPAQRTTKRAIEAFLSRSGGSPPSRSDLEAWSIQGREVQRKAVATLLASNRDQERSVRSLAWALDAPRPWRAGVRFIDARTILSREASTQMRARGNHLDPTPVLWLTDEPPPDLSDAGHFVVLVDASDCTTPRSGRLLVENHVVLDVEGAISGEWMRLPGACGVFQALLDPAEVGQSWRRIRAPGRFRALSQDLSIDVVPQWFAEARTGICYRNGDHHELVIPENTLPKTTLRPRCHSARPVPYERGGRHMSERISGTIMTEFDAEGRAIPITHPYLIASWNPHGRSGARSPDEVTQMSEKRIDSVLDACTAFDVRIEGSFRGITGDDILVSQPVTGPESFTPESLTRSIPELLQAYVVANSCDHLVSHLAQRHRDRLTEDEVRYLQSIIVAIDEAIAGEDQ